MSGPGYNFSERFESDSQNTPGVLYKKKQDQNEFENNKCPEKTDK